MPRESGTNSQNVWPRSTESNDSVSLNMRSVIAFLLLWGVCCLNGCGDKPPGAESASRRDTNLVDEKQYPRNWLGDEIDVQLCAYKNADALRQLVLRDSPADTADFASRMADDSLAWDVRALYAAVLAARDEQSGRDFLLSAARDLESQRVGDVFWLIGNLPSFAPSEGLAAQPNVTVLKENQPIGTVEFVPLVQKEMPLRPDLTWAVPLMLEAIGDTRMCKQKLTWTDVCNRDVLNKAAYPDQTVRDLALHYGGFHRLLAHMRSEKAVPMFCDYVLSTTPEASVGGIISDLAVNEILRFLLSWDTPQVERTLLAVALQAEKREYGARQVAIVLPWFIERKKAEAIPLMLNNLEEMEVYSAVVGTKHRPYLEAIRQKLAALQDRTLTGPALHRQRSVRHHAELILIMGEESDPIPKLMRFAADPENGYERHFAIFLMHTRADSRLVHWADGAIRIETDDYQRFCLIRLLGTLPGREADKVLVDLLHKNARLTQTSHQNEIVKALETRTGKKYGADPVKWRNWLQEETGH
jgi:hypothetical protein